MYKSIVIIFMAGLLLIGGCSENTVAPQQTTPTDEIPAKIQALYEESLEPEALIPSNLTLDNSETNVDLTTGTYDVYSVTLLWGSLITSDNTAATLMDWSGNLSMNGPGCVNVVYEIDFEAGQDYVIPYETEVTATSVAWVSYTGYDIDGLSFLIYVRNDVATFAPVELTLTTESYSNSWYIDELSNLSAWYPVDNLSGLGIFARKIWTGTTEGGFLEGKWTKANNTGTEGNFNGVWLNMDGEPEGVFAGEFWTDESGHGRFEGTISGYMLTVVIGEFKGIWFYDDLRECVVCGADHGVLLGRFAMVDNNRRGVMYATIGDWNMPTVDQLELPMKGFWRYCPDAAVSLSDILE